MKHKLLLLYSWFVRVLLFFAPDIPFIMRFRGFLYGLGMKRCGRNFQATHTVILNGLDEMSIGENVYIANNCVLISNGEITIGNDVLLAPSVVVSSGNHQFCNGSFRHIPSIKENVCIEPGSWIAANVTIIGGSVVPTQSIIGANSVVTKKWIIFLMHYLVVFQQNTLNN